MIVSTLFLVMARRKVETIHWLIDQSVG